MEVKIISPDSTLFDGEADMVVVPGIDGLIGILNNHAPLISSLKKGAVKIKKDKEDQLFDIGGGVVEVMNNNVVVLVS